MKTALLAVAGLLAAGVAPAHAQAAAAPAAAAVPDSLKGTLAQAGYAIGLNLGRNLKKDSIAIDPQVVMQGLKDGLAGITPALNDDQMRAAVAQLQTDVQTQRQEKAAQAAQANGAAGAAFLKANAAKPGVVTLPSGLQYQILKAGTGPTPKADDTVVCNYRGTLIDGKEFDSSYARGAPATLNLGGVIKGWTEALQHMPVGSKWRLVVPSDLAYGAKGAGDDIGPDAVLVFEVELLSIQPPAG